jgi:hypothetical protein
MPEKLLANFIKVIWNHEKVIADIKNEKRLMDYFIDNNIAILICALIYGAVLGFYAGGSQIPIDSIKIPLLFFITFYISLPVFYILSLLSGLRVKFFQMAVLVLTGYSVVAIIMISFTPVILFFIITAKEYLFTVFLNIGILSLAGYFATVYIIKNFKMFFENQKWLPSVTVGCFVIAFVGTQLAWTLRPFFRSYAGFARPVSGNFYIAVTTAAAENPHVSGPLIALFMFIIIMMTLYYIFSSPAKPISASQIDNSKMLSEPDGKKSKSSNLISPACRDCKSDLKFSLATYKWYCVKCNSYV